MGGAIAIAIQVLEALPLLVKLTQEVGALISSTVTALKAMQAAGRDPTPEEWAAIDGQIKGLLGSLDQPGA